MTVPGTTTLDDEESQPEHDPQGSERAPRAVFLCGGCTETWTALGACHCATCHRTFSGLGLFDAHRSPRGEHGTCLDPAKIRDKNGQPKMFFRNAMWRGPEREEGSY